VQVFENGTEAGAATRYAYDPHGNVKTLWQRLPELSETKKIEYNYDLISGKVNELVYQKGKDDEFRHRYDYDADNRIISAKTSREGYIWNEEAHYFYYAHGPLARTELGEYKVQGLDYFYTLQGWIKGVNMPDLAPANDLGKDGATSGKNKFSSKDVFSFSLFYFSGEYQSISGMSLATPSFTSLYNGNIGAMNTTLSLFGAHTRAFRYDQLNRLKEAKNANGGDKWRENFAYDADGNMTKLQRYDDFGMIIDDVKQHYQSGTNRMTHIEDFAGVARPDCSAPHFSNKKKEKIRWTL
jgi:hypothetical protein